MLVEFRYFVHFQDSFLVLKRLYTVENLMRSYSVDEALVFTFQHHESSGRNVSPFGTLSLRKVEIKNVSWNKDVRLLIL